MPSTSLLTGEWNYSYDDAGTSNKRTYANHGYDAYGNRIETDLYGDWTASGDETTLAWTYRPNTASYIVDRVAKQQQFNGIGMGGTKLAERLLYYDGANTWDQAPSQGYVTASLGLLSSESRYVRRNMGYDAYGNLTSVTDEANRSATTGYDASFHVFPTSVTNGANETQTTVWDAICGVPSQRTDANSQVSTMQFDMLCRPTRTDLPLGIFEIRSYPSLGDPNAQHLRIETPSSVPGINLYAEAYFDGLGRTYHTTKKGPAGADTLQDTAYDTRGRVSSQTAPYYSGSASQATSYTYDAVNRMKSAQFPDGHSVSRSYPAWGQSDTDEHGHVVTTSFDGYGRRILSEQHLLGLPVQTHYSYDLLGEMTGMTDHLGNAWSWTFDSLGRNTQKADPDAGTWTFTYDDSGLLTHQVDANAGTIDFTYDAVGRLATKSAGGMVVTRSEARTGFYNMSRVTTITSNARSITMDYDALGRAVKQTSTLDGSTYVAQKQFGTGGFLQTITYPDNDSIGPMLYDAAGRLRSIPGIVNDTQYDAADRPTLQTNANGTTSTRSYTPERGFLTAIVTTGAGTPPATIQNLAYTPDPAGMVTQVTSPFTNETWSYSYDDLHRLTAATGLQTQTFQYDEIGRITYNSLVGTYSYGTSHPHAPSSVAGNPMTYDTNGQLLSGRGRTISWNVRNLPTQVNGTVFNYDGLDRRRR